MNNIKVTQLSIEEVKKKIYDNDIENVYVLSMILYTCMQ